MVILPKRLSNIYAETQKGLAKRLYNIYAEDVVSRLPNGEYCESFDKIADRVFEMAREGDLFITLGCGDIYKAAKLITKRQTEM